MSTDMPPLEFCRECGVEIRFGNWEFHAQWHEELRAVVEQQDRTIVQLQSELEMLKRKVRNV